MQHLLVGELRHPPGVGKPDLFHDLVRLGGPDSMDVLQCDDHTLVGWDIDASDTGQSRFSSCRLQAGSRASAAPPCGRSASDLTRLQVSSAGQRTGAESILYPD